jgi:hypothetical protein
MRNLLTLILLGTLLAGCAPASITVSATQDASSGVPSQGNQKIMSVATEGRFTEEAPTEDPGSPALVMTVNSPPIVLTPIQANITPLAPTLEPSSTDNWNTYSSAALGVTVNYPPDWTVTEQADTATFTSPQDATINLQAANPGGANNEFRIGNQYCTTRTNSHQQTARVCADNASFTYSATFTLQAAGGSTHGVILITKTRSAGTIFEAMIDSLRPTQ